MLITLYQIKELYSIADKSFSIRLQIQMNIERLKEIENEGFKKKRKLKKAIRHQLFLYRLALELSK